MRAALASLTVGLALTAPVAADPLPPGSIGVFFGGATGTGADTDVLGLGYVVGAAAAWQPMSTEQRINWALKWSIGFAVMNYLDPTHLGTELRLIQLDLMPGVRFRLGESHSGYATLRAGGTLERTNQVLPDHMGRAFAGAAASAGYDLYLGGYLLSIDARYSVIGTGPTMLGLNIGLAKTGP